MAIFSYLRWGGGAAPIPCDAAGCQKPPLAFGLTPRHPFFRDTHRRRARALLGSGRFRPRRGINSERVELAPAQPGLARIHPPAPGAPPPPPATPGLAPRRGRYGRGRRRRCPKERPGTGGGGILLRKCWWEGVGRGWTGNLGSGRRKVAFSGWKMQLQIHYPVK